MRHGIFHIFFAIYLTLFLGVLLPAHNDDWLRIPDGDAAEALVPPPQPGQDQLPHQHDCEHCAFCQFAAHMTHCPPPPPLIRSLLPLNHVFIARTPLFIPADVWRTSDSRGPPTA
jgi:hypothetical protein